MAAVNFAGNPVVRSGSLNQGAASLQGAMATQPAPSPAAVAAQQKRAASDKQNYWKLEQQKAFSSPFAKSAPEMLKLQSEGEDDWQRKLKLSIRRQYFNVYQYMGGVLLGVATGILVTCLVFVFALDFPFTMFGEDPNVSKWQWGWFLVTFFMSELAGRVETRRQFHCDPYNKDVDARRRGMDCITNRDCSVAQDLKGGLCVRRSPGAFVGFMRIYVPYVAFLGGVLLLILADAPAPPRDQIAPAVLFGVGSGMVWGYVFS